MCKKLGGGFDPEHLVKQIEVLEAQMRQPDFWADQIKAQTVAQQYGDLNNELNEWQDLQRRTQEALALVEADQANQTVNLQEELKQIYQSLLKRVDKLEVRGLLNSQYDQTNALLAIHAGAGGTDAQDWAAMLLRMFLRFADSQGWTTQVLDESVGQEAGLKSVLVKVTGRFAYGYLKCEAGVHRLVRISPFDAEKLRHTSFALVEVLPELPTVNQVTIDDKDLRVDTFMSSGHGGQGVNTTYSAVRLVHLPTGLTVTCQNERSQTQNKETALKYLQAKLWQLAYDRQQDTKKQLRGELKSAEWGNQTRSYVLHPYKMVKDHRTDFTSNNPAKVLDGDLLLFIEARLKQLAVQSKK